MGVDNSEGVENSALAPDRILCCRIAAAFRSKMKRSIYATERVAGKRALICFQAFRPGLKSVVNCSGYMRKLALQCFWLLLAIAGAGAYAMLALHRGEPLNSAYILIAALC